MASLLHRAAIMIHSFVIMMLCGWYCVLLREQCRKATQQQRICGDLATRMETLSLSVASACALNLTRLIIAG